MKCNNCSTLGPDHLFRDCQSYTCACLCVQQLRNAPPNQNLEEISADQPEFLNITKISRLKGINNDLLNKFVKLRKDEWLTSKQDHRTKEFRSKR